MRESTADERYQLGLSLPQWVSLIYPPVRGIVNGPDSGPPPTSCFLTTTSPLSALLVREHECLRSRLLDNAVWLVSVQIFDGISAGTLDALIPLVLADVMRGTGRYNVARGVLGTVQGVAGSLSNVVAGLLVVMTSYTATFLVLATMALGACMLLLMAMPETAATRTKQ